MHFIFTSQVLWFLMLSFQPSGAARSAPIWHNDMCGFSKWACKAISFGPSLVVIALVHHTDLSFFFGPLNQRAIFGMETTLPTCHGRRHNNVNTGNYAMVP